MASGAAPGCRLLARGAGGTISAVVERPSGASAIVETVPCDPRSVIGAELGENIYNGYTHMMADRDYPLARLTPRMLEQSRVIAKGNRIGDVQRLVLRTAIASPVWRWGTGCFCKRYGSQNPDVMSETEHLVGTYGGKASQWVKKSSPRFEIGRYQYEYHWYEHPGLGRVEGKRQRVQAI